MPSFVWDNKSGRYRDTSSQRFVSRNVVLKHLDLQGRRSKTYMQQTATKLVNRELSLSQFQTQMIDEIKRSHIRMGLLASGGKDNVSNANYGSMGNRLKQEYEYLNNFVRAIADGELSTKQIVNRAGMYGNSSASAFYKSEQVSRYENRQGKILVVKRSLDVGVNQHCRECPALSTNGKYLPVEQVTVPTRSCSCRSNCRCLLFYKYITPKIRV